MTEIDLRSNYSRRMTWKNFLLNEQGKITRNPDLCPFDFAPKVDDCEESMRNSLEPDRCDSSMDPLSALVGGLNGKRIINSTTEDLLSRLFEQAAFPLHSLLRFDSNFSSDLTSECGIHQNFGGKSKDFSCANSAFTL